MDDYISKPVRSKALEEVIKRLLADSGQSPKITAALSQEAKPVVDLMPT
jgi:DNA-binding response OmpR family regulator